MKSVVLFYRGWYGTLKKVAWYFEEGGILYGTLKRLVWYFEDGGVYCHPDFATTFIRRLTHILTYPYTQSHTCSHS